MKLSSLLRICYGHPHHLRPSLFTKGSRCWFPSFFLFKKLEFFTPNLNSPSIPLSQSINTSSLTYITTTNVLESNIQPGDCPVSINKTVCFHNFFTSSWEGSLTSLTSNSLSENNKLNEFTSSGNRPSFHSNPCFTTSPSTSSFYFHHLYSTNPLSFMTSHHEQWHWFSTNVRIPRLDFTRVLSKLSFLPSKLSSSKKHSLLLLHSSSPSSSTLSSSSLPKSSTKSSFPISFTPISWDFSNSPPSTTTSSSTTTTSTTTSTTAASTTTSTSSPSDSFTSSSMTPSSSFQTLLHTCSYWSKVYLDLSKARLASLVTLTTMVGYAMAPTSTTLATLLATTVGTSLCVASANTLNQLMESPYDAQMSRTRSRPLVKHVLSPCHAFVFGSMTGLVGILMLHYFVNSLTAGLGLVNLFLYTCVYTPMKRFSTLNTWVGAMVGAIPPMMGWAACTGSLLWPYDSGAYLLGFLLYAWQFPHFNALAYNLRHDYSKAGYFMMAVTHPTLNARVALRYALLLFPWTVFTTLSPMNFFHGLGLVELWSNSSSSSSALLSLPLTTPNFLIPASMMNSIMVYQGYKFWNKCTEKSARDLFFISLLHLPVILALLMFYKYTPPEMNSNPNLNSTSTSHFFTLTWFHPWVSSFSDSMFFSSFSSSFLEKFNFQFQSTFPFLIKKEQSSLNQEMNLASS